MHNPFQDRLRLGRFGFDPQTGELWPLEGEGSRVVLPQQPFQILSMLLGRHGKIVTREEIRDKLWPGDTTVDFDHSINVAIGALRRTLGDSAESPRYIETLARRGYRLVVSPEPLLPREVEKPEERSTVTVQANPGSPENVTNQSKPTPPPSGSVEITPSQISAGPVRAASPVRWSMATLGLLALAMLVWWLYLETKSSFQLSPSETVVIAVTNKTADPVFNDALYISLLTALEQTPYINVLAVNKVAEATRALHVLVDPTRISPDLARKVCLQTGSKLVIHTAIAEVGNNFRINQEAIDCRSGRSVAQATKEVAGRRAVIHVLGLVTASLRGALGEPKASLSRFDNPLEQASSASPDALQMLTEGYRHSLLADFIGAIAYYQRAAQIDPNLAMAYIALAGAEDSAGHEAAATRAATAGYRLRDRLTTPLRMNAEDIYYLFATGEVEKRCSVLSQFVQLFPSNHTAHINLAGCLQSLGDFAGALAEARESVRLLPSSVSYHAQISAATLSGRYEEASAAFRDAIARHFDSALLREDRFLLAFLQTDSAQMQEQRAWAASHPGINHELLFEEALSYSYSGNNREYLRVSEQAADSAAKAGSLLDAESYKAKNALTEAEFGNFAEARRIAVDTLAENPSRDTTLVLALAFARAGDAVQARKLEGAIRRDWPRDALVQNLYLPSIDAAIRLQENDSAGAIKILRPALKYDFAFIPGFGNLYPSYLRGLAYEKAGEPGPAAEEFQKVLDHPGLAGFSQIGSLAWLQIARAYAAKAGERSLALSSYNTFLTRWKDADRDLPVYRIAHAESSKLHVSRDRHSAARPTA